jgi:hemolysin-activating ACP:hemolysin acyltransferase
MSTIDFIRGGLRQLHGSYDEAIADLTDEQLHWRANEHGLPISFILWHYVRTQDNVVNFVLQRKPAPSGWTAAGTSASGSRRRLRAPV